MKNHIKSLFLFLLFVFVLGSNQLSGQKYHSGPQDLSFFSSVDETDQPYTIYIPKNFDESKKYPLVVFLHGAMSNHRLGLRRVFGQGNIQGEDFITSGFVPVETNLELSRPDIWAAIAPVCPAPPAGTNELAGNALNIPVHLFIGDQDFLYETAQDWRKLFETNNVDYGLVYILPLNNHYVLVNSGKPWWTPPAKAEQDRMAFSTSASNALANLKDFILFKETPDNIISEGYFDENWEIPVGEATRMKSAEVIHISE